jgi:hypothetical protein
MFAAYVVVSVLLAACVASSAAVDFAISRSSSLWRGRGTGVAAAVAGLAQRSLRGRTAAAIGVPLIGTAAAIGVVLLFVGAVAVERRGRRGGLQLLLVEPGVRARSGQPGPASAAQQQSAKQLSRSANRLRGDQGKPRSTRAAVYQPVPVLRSMRRSQADPGP